MTSQDFDEGHLHGLKTAQGYLSVLTKGRPGYDPETVRLISLAVEGMVDSAGRRVAAYAADSGRVPCQVADPDLSLPCKATEGGGGYQCEVVGPHERHAIGHHTIHHALAGNGYDCSAIEGASA
jgi:hypothetical protein